MKIIMLKIVKNYSNLIPNVSKIKEILEKEGIMPISTNSKFSNNTVSSKVGNINQSKQIIRQKIRTNKEYQRMYEEEGKKGLCPEDMRLADEETYENPAVPS